MIELNANGGWCWYQDPRVIVDPSDGAVLFASVANRSGADGERRNGDIDVTRFSPPDRAETTALAKIPTLGLGDDHNAAALWQRPDGRYLAVYTGHLYGSGLNDSARGKDTAPTSFSRVSRAPHDAAEWGPERGFSWPANDPTGNGNHDVTYANLLHLAEEGGERGRLYNFARAAGRAMHVAYSDDWGDTWAYGGILSLPPGTGRAYSNGYFKFCGNGRDRIDFIATEAHPRDYNNGVYHGFIRAGKSHDAAGNVIDGDLFREAAPPPEAFTPVFAPSDERGHHHAWTTQLERGRDGRLYALFTTRYGDARAPGRFTHPGPGEADHRLFLAVLEDGAWRASEIARMGPGLHPDQEDYTGLAALDPRDGATVYVSTCVDPRDDASLARWELFAGKRGDEGVWRWSPITWDSPEENLRPQLAVIDDDAAALLWLRGTYPHQRDYAERVVGRILGRAGTDA